MITTGLPLQVVLHLAAILPAMALGVTQLAMAKGTPAHRLIGRIWVVLMLTAAISSFWIQRGGFSWIHGLSVVTLVSVVAGVISARRGNRRRHAGFMFGAFIGTIGAGIGALAPGRLLNGILF